MTGLILLLAIDAEADAVALAHAVALARAGRLPLVAACIARTSWPGRVEGEEAALPQEDRRLSDRRADHLARAARVEGVQATSAVISGHPRQAVRALIAQHAPLHVVVGVRRQRRGLAAILHEDPARAAERAAPGRVLVVDAATAAPAP